MAVQIPDNRPVPVIPASGLTTDPIFGLTYKHAHMIQTLYFQSASLESAIKDGNAFCTAKRLRFITVTPFIQDIKTLTAKVGTTDDNAVMN